MKTNIGGDRLGSGNKMEVTLKNFERSTHDQGYTWRSSMASGTLVPFLHEIGLPGTNFEIDLDIDVKTLPTNGPLFGSYKVQADIFQAPMRLYQGKLHMNKLGIGLDMSSVKLPLMVFDTYWDENNGDLQQVNPSCILSYLGINGAGRPTSAGTTPGDVQRKFNANGLLMYWDVYKTYYANKQEGRGFVISSNSSVRITAAEWTDTTSSNADCFNTAVTLDIDTSDATTPTLKLTLNDPQSDISEYDLAGITIILSDGVSGVFQYALTDLFDTFELLVSGKIKASNWKLGLLQSPWEIIVPIQTVTTITGPELVEFDLDNIDTMREDILVDVKSASAFEIDSTSNAPYGNLFTNITGNLYAAMNSQEGLGIKTYQSDLFNNWIDTEFIDGVNGVNEVTKVDTTGNEFTIDALNLAQKVYMMLNRVALSDGSYDAWINAVYSHDFANNVESPIYHGSLIKELAFEEVVSQASADNADGNNEPLGQLAGRGRLTGKHKGGKINIRIDTPSIIMGIISITPRVDYSQGNSWINNIRTMDEWHKPDLDEIGFQDAITDRQAWFDTVCTDADVQTFASAGKQPAWINYMTNVDRTHGNFADINKEMFMTLNRRYEFGADGIQDLTTYVDPTKYNNIFADTNLDAQNFWTQIAVRLESRRKMSAKQIPNL